MDQDLQPGQLLARGVSRHLRTHDFATALEFVPQRGLRVDVMALGAKGELWVIECKSSRNDYNSDHKWQGYLEWCDRFFWCVDADFPVEILPPGTGLIIADKYDAQIMHYGPESKLSPARRKSLTLALARSSMFRLQSALDPAPSRKFSAI